MSAEANCSSHLMTVQCHHAPDGAFAILSHLESCGTSLQPMLPLGGFCKQGSHTCWVSYCIAFAAIMGIINYMYTAPTLCTYNVPTLCGHLPLGPRILSPTRRCLQMWDHTLAQFDTTRFPASGGSIGPTSAVSSFLPRFLCSLQASTQLAFLPT